MHWNDVNNKVVGTEVKIEIDIRDWGTQRPKGPIALS